MHFYYTINMTLQDLAQEALTGSKKYTSSVDCFLLITIIQFVWLIPRGWEKRILVCFLKKFIQSLGLLDDWGHELYNLCSRWYIPIWVKIGSVVFEKKLNMCSCLRTMNYERRTGTDTNSWPENLKGCVTI